VASCRPARGPSEAPSLAHGPLRQRASGDASLPPLTHRSLPPGPADAMLVDTFKVVSPNVEYTEDAIRSTYRYDSTRISRTRSGEFQVEPTSSTYEFSVDRRVPKLGCGGEGGLGWAGMS
jgi:hypothetical protein